MNDTPKDPNTGDDASTSIPPGGRDVSPPERAVIRHPRGFRINMGRIGVALSLVPFAAIAFGAALGLP
jgi:hypothetical protein